VLPVLAKTDFKGDAGTYALMLIAMGVGSVAGALISARNRGPRLRVVVGAAAAMGVAMLVAAAARSLALEVAVLVTVGFFSLLYLSTTNSTCQLASAPEMRGRVMGVYTVILTGSTPVGALLIGLVDQELGARWGFVFGAVPTLVAAALLGAVLLRRDGAAPISPRSMLARRRGTGAGAPASSG
jgi:predicted MFS family arabinose efflux permease